MRTPSPWQARDAACRDHYAAALMGAEYVVPLILFGGDSFNDGMEANPGDESPLISDPGSPRGLLAEGSTGISESESCGNDAIEETGGGELIDKWSRGAVGHPHRCAQPCKFFATKRGCKDGTQCTRCHVCPWRRQCK